MYCIKCGVRLADTEKSCPLCGTRCCHPDIPAAKADPLYPRHIQPRSQVSPLGAMSALTILCLIPLVICLLCDLRINSRITWSGYVTGAIFLFYEIFLLPGWFRAPNPVIFVPCGFAAIALYLYYISAAVDGGWFWPFALPLTGGVCLIFTAVVTLVRYVKKGHLFIFGGAAIALGGMVLLAEYLLKLTFGVHAFIGWSLYPLAALVLLGGFLIYLGINPTAREVMERKLFI